MEQALYGLLLNAIDASPPGGTVSVGAAREADGLRLRIADDGPGMAFEPQPSGLRPGPSTKRSGTGLGIPFAHKVCQAHGWGLAFAKRPTGGTEVGLLIADWSRTVKEPAHDEF
jgi:signal transduction histidine kinase